jgi:hypothetical protein
MKTKVTAIYAGECYDRAFGRKLYKKAILLKEVKDLSGKVIFEEIKVSKTKIFNNSLKNGDKIVLSAKIDNNKMSYLELEEVYNYNVK